MSLNKINIRPIILGLNIDENLSFEETFQNKTLRPIIKLQHDILTAYFQEYLIARHCNFEVLLNIQKEDFIFNLFSQNNNFKIEIKGMIIGLFNVAEFKDYCCNKRDFNKRILTIVKQRIISSVVYDG